MQNFNDFLTNNYLLIKALHVISMGAWMAAILYLPRLFVYHTEVKKNCANCRAYKLLYKSLDIQTKYRVRNAKNRFAENKKQILFSIR